MSEGVAERAKDSLDGLLGAGSVEKHPLTVLLEAALGIVREGVQDVLGPVDLVLRDADGPVVHRNVVRGKHEVIDDDRNHTHVQELGGTEGVVGVTARRDTEVTSAEEGLVAIGILGPLLGLPDDEALLVGESIEDLGADVRAVGANEAGGPLTRLAKLIEARWLGGHLISKKRLEHVDVVAASQVLSQIEANENHIEPSEAVTHRRQVVRIVDILPVVRATEVGKLLSGLARRALLGVLLQGVDVGGGGLWVGPEAVTLEVSSVSVCWIIIRVGGVLHTPFRPHDLQHGIHIDKNQIRASRVLGVLRMLAKGFHHKAVHVGHASRLVDRLQDAKAKRSRLSVQVEQAEIATSGGRRHLRLEAHLRLKTSKPLRQKTRVPDRLGEDRKEEERGKHRGARG
mmetsp:Transcript_3543/g.7084  ORF Transcript_3543/g.7084 Transcript_3543/m.7084 type:complete len:400 (+) Transcript_3543:1045-2244(+)